MQKKGGLVIEAAPGSMPDEIYLEHCMRVYFLPFSGDVSKMLLSRKELSVIVFFKNIFFVRGCHPQGIFARSVHDDMCICFFKCYINYEIFSYFYIIIPNFYFTAI